MMVENLLMIPLALALAELGRQCGEGLRGALIGTFRRLLRHPIILAISFGLLPAVDQALRTAAVLFACAPMMSIFPILGQRYGLEGRCAAALVVCTVLSFLTISVFVGLLR